MKRSLNIVPLTLAALSLAAVACAGGDLCSGKSQAAKQVSAGSHCPGVSSTQAKGDHCAIGADQAVLSFAVPGAECDVCVKTIQRAAMAQKGVTCAHVNLDNHTAYIIGDKSLNQRAIAKAIKGAGFRCTFKAQGPKIRSELLRAMASGGSAACCAKKEKDKV